MHVVGMNQEYIEEFAGVATNTQLMHLLFQALVDAYAPESGRQKYWHLNIGENPELLNNETHQVDHVDLGELDDLNKEGLIVEETNKYITAQTSIISSCADRLKESLSLKVDH
jgi:hypothetical protein